MKLIIPCIAISLLFFSTSCKTQQIEQEANTVESAANDRNGQRGQRGQRGTPPTVDELFAQMDADGDNLLSESEVKGRMLENFSTIDTDNNGLLSKEEVEKAPKPERRRKRTIN